MLLGGLDEHLDGARAHQRGSNPRRDGEVAQRAHDPGMHLG